MKINLKAIILTGIFAAITAVLSQVSIPIPFSPVPITLSLVAVFLSSIILGSKFGTISQIVYLLLGAVGVPVFANFHGGIGVLLGPTGGFLLSYPFVSLIIGLFINKKEPLKTCDLILPVSLGLIICYTFGSVWLAYVTKMTFINTISMGVLPFIPLDIIKVIFIILTGSKIRNSLQKSNLNIKKPLS